MMKGFTLGRFELHWLKGGRFALDGGSMFGVVPKVLWSKRYPADDENYIPLVAWPILVKTPHTLVLIESGLGNKLTEKQRRIFRLSEPWDVEGDLKTLRLRREDIEYVILTHCDFDHAGGVVMYDGQGRPMLSFPKAVHVVHKREWEDVMHPNMRSVNTYWPLNFEVLRESMNLKLVEGEVKIANGVTVVHTGGHTNGHQIIKLESDGERAIHMGDLLPTHAHFNPLWIMAYDTFPLESVRLKDEIEVKAIREHAWFTFYHDPFFLACRFNERGEIVEKWTG